MHKILIASLIILFSIDFFPYTYVDKDLQQYNSIYDSYVHLYCDNRFEGVFSQINIKFDNLELPMIGYCQQNSNGYSIRIDKRYWYNTSDINKQTLLFHEKSHCVLGMDHSKNINNYMYEKMEDNLDHFMLYNQIRNDIIEHCKEK